jgi:hypothetical protein
MARPSAAQIGKETQAPQKGSRPIEWKAIEGIENNAIG